MTPQQKAMTEASSFVAKLNDLIIFPVIFLLSGIAFLVFLYGAAEYIFNAGSDQAQEQGKKHITYGLIGLFVMSSAYALLSIGTGTFGLNKQLDCARDPNQAGCESVFQVPK